MTSRNNRDWGVGDHLSYLIASLQLTKCTSRWWFNTWRSRGISFDYTESWFKGNSKRITKRSFVFKLCKLSVVLKELGICNHIQYPLWMKLKKTLLWEVSKYFSSWVDFHGRFFVIALSFHAANKGVIK